MGLLPLKFNHLQWSTFLKTNPLPPIISLKLLQGFSEFISFQTLKGQKTSPLPIFKNQLRDRSSTEVFFPKRISSQGTTSVGHLLRRYAKPRVDACRRFSTWNFSVMDQKIRWRGRQNTRKTLQIPENSKKMYCRSWAGYNIYILYIYIYTFIPRV